MTEYHYAFLMFSTITVILYTVIGWGKIIDRIKMWFTREYWTDYNTVEFFAWFAKALIIIPGLIFAMEIWWLHIFTLITSSALIWASMRKSLPTLIVFNTLWLWISSLIIVRHFI